MDSNDHRIIAQRLDLFHFQEEAPGMAFWHPNGLLLLRLLEDAVRRHVLDHGYLEVRTPQLLRKPVWEASGHWEHFYDGMFRFASGPEEAALKPVSCPGHVCLFGQRSASYRELPLRFAEFGLVHRDEPSGTLHGLFRLRQFTQDDGHIFCTPEQAEHEVEAFCREVGPFYAKFGFEVVAIVLSTRPERRAGDDASWDRAEQALRNVLERLDSPHSLAPGAGAFYGPKLEFVLRDSQGREWSCGTIQFDLVMPRRFDVHYVEAGGARPFPVMLHRALYGSFERFLGMLLEQHAQSLPAWLCPTQVLVAPVAEAHRDWSARVAARLSEEGLRVRLDDRSETLGKRVAEAHEARVPFVAVVGAREAEARQVSVRAQGSQAACDLDVAAQRLAAQCASPFAGRPRA
jgi:threonyl-tRNA synthetase